MKEAQHGLVSKIKILRVSPYPLVRFTLTRDEDELNCLINQHALNFLYQVNDGDYLAAFGHTNKRKQFVIEKFAVQKLNQTEKVLQK
ncbi:hypothetical protein [Enterococcus timonensis]|uniref:hypothetical protein n=1 Tax=Enterococcus timonensis TaxID=1852364 RepID=UPI0008DAF209|nr:hypothetical protein [Enterococcus timonensis]